jgi:hypothetical protein
VDPESGDDDDYNEEERTVTAPAHSASGDSRGRQRRDWGERISERTVISPNVPSRKREAAAADVVVVGERSEKKHKKSKKHHKKKKSKSKKDKRDRH